MDHLSTKIDNLIQAKVSKPPIFGAVSWIRVDPENLTEGKLTGFTAWTVSSGTVLNEPIWAVLHPSSTQNISGKISNFNFEAFDQSVDLTALVGNIVVLLEHFEKIVRPRIETNVRDGAKSRGMDPEEVLKARGSGGLKTGLKIRRESEGASS